MASFQNNYSGKHMICDIKEIKNKQLLNDVQRIRETLSHLCTRYNFTVLDIIEHIFEPQGFTMLFLLSESHISIHTFPENDYFALDIYTCREYENNNEYMDIYNFLVVLFDAKKEAPIIIDRPMRTIITQV
jgi:S-adenosylmethionine decarboxylase proenzyme